MLQTRSVKGGKLARDRSDKISKKIEIETYGNKFETNQLADLEQVTIARHSEQESNRVANVANNHVESQWRIVDVQITTPPCKKAVTKGN